MSRDPFAGLLDLYKTRTATATPRPTRLTSSTANRATSSQPPRKTASPSSSTIENLETQSIAPLPVNNKINPVTSNAATVQSDVASAESSLNLLDFSNQVAINNTTPSDTLEASSSSVSSDQQQVNIITGSDKIEPVDATDVISKQITTQETATIQKENTQPAQSTTESHNKNTSTMAVDNIPTETGKISSSPSTTMGNGTNILHNQSHYTTPVNLHASQDEANRASAQASRTTSPSVTSSGHPFQSTNSTPPTTSRLDLFATMLAQPTKSTGGNPFAIERSRWAEPTPQKSQTPHPLRSTQNTVTTLPRPRTNFSQPEVPRHEWTAARARALEETIQRRQMESPRPFRQVSSASATTASPTVAHLSTSALGGIAAFERIMNLGLTPIPAPQSLGRNATLVPSLPLTGPRSTTPSSTPSTISQPTALRAKPAASVSTQGSVVGATDPTLRSSTQAPPAAHPSSTIVEPPVATQPKPAASTPRATVQQLVAVQAQPAAISSSTIIEQPSDATVRRRRKLVTVRIVGDAAPLASGPQSKPATVAVATPAVSVSAVSPTPMSAQTARPSVADPNVHGNTSPTSDPVSMAPVQRPANPSAPADLATTFDPSAFGAVQKVAEKLKPTNSAPSTTIRMPVNPAVKHDASNVDNENKMRFDAWPKPVDRGTAPAQPRIIELRNLPSNADALGITKLLFGGSIELIDWSVGNPFAIVHFLTHEGYRNFFDNTANGIPYPGTSKHAKAVWVENVTELQPLSSVVREAVDKYGASRCVRAVGVEADWGEIALRNIGKGGRNGTRVVVGMTDELNASKVRVVTWHFMSISAAVQFYSHMQRNEDAEGWNFTYVPDPCATATGPRA